MGQAERLTERIGDWREDSRVERESRLVQNVALAGRHSRNGYSYSEQALREAVALYEGRPVFLDHAASGAPPLERSARDLVGSIVRARYEGERIRGDIEVLDTESGRTFLALAEGKAAAVGMSHVVLAVRGDDKRTVERIEEVISVDAVVFPATTVTLREGETASGNTEAGWEGSPLPGSLEAELAELDALLATLPGSPRRVGMLDDRVILATRPAGDGNAGDGGEQEVWESRQWLRSAEAGIQLEASGVQLSEQERAALCAGRTCSANARKQAASQAASPVERQHRRLLRKYVELRGRLVSLERAERLLAEAGLPGEAISPEFRRLLGELREERSQRELIAERSRWWNRRPTQTPVSQARTGKESQLDEERFIRAIRR